MNLSIASVLFLVTLVALYAMWRLVRGRKAKATAASSPQADGKEKDGDGPSEKKEKKKGKWGVDKDSYCYPNINDMMGYEFVKVVKVPDYLTGGPAPQPSAAPAPAWDMVRSVSPLSAVPADARETAPEDEAFPEKPVPGKAVPRRRNQDTEEIPEDGVTQVDAEAEDELYMMQKFNDTWGEWDHDTGSLPSEEELNIILDQNEQVIEQPVINNESVRTEEEIRALKKVIQETEDVDFTEQTNELLNDLS